MLAMQMVMKVLPHKHQLHICHILDSGGLYGIERMVFNLSVACSQRGHKVTILFLRPLTIDTQTKNRLLKKGVSLHILQQKSAFLPIAILTFLRNIKTDIVHLHGYKATILTGLIKPALLRTPIICTYHAEARHTSVARRYIILESFVLRALDVIVPVSIRIKDEILHRGLDPERVKIIYNGIEPQNVECANGTLIEGGRSFPIIFFVGRLIKIKNVEILIKAFHKFAKLYPSARLYILGDGPLKTKLEDMVSKLGLSDSVIFKGFVVDVTTYFRNADCLVLPSETEGLPITILEAMANRVPIIASSVGMIPKILKNDISALLVEPGDVQKLTSCLEKMFSNGKSYRRRLTDEALNVFQKKFTSHIMANNYINLYYTIYESH